MSGRDPVLSRVRATRRALGLTQVALATRAGVSLATVQNVEAGIANPALETLRRLLAPLGLVLRATPRPVDWDALVRCGLPLMTDRVGDEETDPARLPDLLRHAALACAASPADRPSARHRDALRALLWGLRSHYPTTYEAWFHDAEAVRALTPDEPTGREIKLARIARERLAEIL